MSISDAEKLRTENNILAEGEDLIAPIESFKVLFPTEIKLYPRI